MIQRLLWSGRARQYRIPFTIWLLLLVVLLNLAVQPGLLQPATLNSNLRIFLPLILVTVGQAIAMLGGGIDISVGAIASIANAILATQIGVQGDPGTAILIMALALLAGMLAGALNGLCVAILRLQPIITTYATSFLFSGLALLILPSPGGGVPAAFTSMYRETLPLGIPLGFFCDRSAACGLVRRAPDALRALSVRGRRQGNANAAYQTGAPVNVVRFSTYVISGFMAASGGIALTLLIGSGNAQIGDSLTLTSITAAVIGGNVLSGGIGVSAARSWAR